MIISIFHQGTKDGSAIVNYLFNEEKHAAHKPELVAGNAELTKEIIAGIRRKHKYTTGVISFKHGENLTEAQQLQLIEDFQNTFAPFDDEARSNFLWVRHLDKGRLELHFVHPMIDLKSKNKFSIFVPGKPNLDFFTKFQAVKNYEYGFKQIGKKINENEVTEEQKPFIDSRDLVRKTVTLVYPLRKNDYMQYKKDIEKYIDKRVQYIITDIDNRPLGNKIKKAKKLNGAKNGIRTTNSIKLSTHSDTYSRSRKLNNVNQPKIAISGASEYAMHKFPDKSTDNNNKLGKGNEILARIANKINASKGRRNNGGNDTRREEQNGVNSKSIQNQPTKNIKSNDSMAGLSIDQKLYKLGMKLQSCSVDEMAEIYDQIGRLQAEWTYVIANSKPKI